MIESRVRCRAGQRCQPTTLAEVIAHVALHSERRVDDVAELLFSSAQSGRAFPTFVRWLRKVVSPYEVRATLPAALVGPFCRAFQNTEVVEAIAREAGGVYVPVPDVLDDDDSLLAAHLTAAREFGDQAAKLAAILPGGITACEAAAFDLEVDQAIAALAALKPMVRSRVTAVAV